MPCKDNLGSPSGALYNMGLSAKILFEYLKEKGYVMSEAESREPQSADDLDKKKTKY